MKYSFDGKCLELVKYFYPDVPDDDLRPIAQQLQDACEAFIPPQERCPKRLNGYPNFDCVHRAGHEHQCDFKWREST